MIGDPYTGQELYERYVEILNKRNCEIDPWDALDEQDKEDWNELAKTSTGV
jgi:hypothetical protein